MTVLGTDLAGVAAAPPPISPTDALLYALGPKLLDWYRPTDVVAAGANVGSFVDRVSASRTLDQPTPARQTLLPVPNANANGQLATLINAVATHEYNSNQPAVYWKGCHDGTGVECYFVGVPVTVPGTQVILGTFAGTTPGFVMYTASSNAVVAIQNDTGSRFFNLARVAVTANTKLWFRYHWQEGITSPEAQIVANTGSGAFGDTAAVGFTLPPEFTLRLGAAGCDIWFLDFFRCLVLTPAERTNNVLAYLTARYGF